MLKETYTVEKSNLKPLNDVAFFASRKCNDFGLLLALAGASISTKFRAEKHFKMGHFFERPKYACEKFGFTKRTRLALFKVRLFEKQKPGHCQYSINI